MIVTKVKERLLLNQENLITKEKIENVQEDLDVLRLNNQRKNRKRSGVDLTFVNLLTKENENVQE